MKYIQLTKGKQAIVDDEDFEYLSQWKWHYSEPGYALHWDKRKKVYMHRLVNKTSIGLQTDHINKNKLDNRKFNLRSVTHQGNSINRPLIKSNRSGYTGVSWDKSVKKWASYIYRNYKKRHLGYFINKEDAVIAYLKEYESLSPARQ